MKPRRVIALATAGAFFILAVATVVVAKKEIVMATQAPLWRAEDIIPLGIEHLTAYSIRADYATIDACLRLTNAVEGLLLPSVERAKRAKMCQNVAENMLSSSPLNAYAWFALANFSHISGQLDEMNRALERSYATGPNEQWIAEQRVKLAEDALTSLSEMAMLGHQNDLAMLVQSRRGIRAIALRYMGNSEFRGRISAIAEGLPTADQRRFISVLRREVQSN